MRFCECLQDGFCARYQREMTGRFREVCAGINVDLGTAAAFREQWRREARVETRFSEAPIPLLLKTDQAPGDALAMTAAIYSLHRAHPSRYVTAVESYWPDVFAHNPDVAAHVMPGERVDTGLCEVQMHYPAIHESNERGIHFMQAWCEFLGAALGINVPLMTNRPRLYFNSPALPQGDYWIICSGGKRDFTTKLWGHQRYQEVVRRTWDRIRWIQVGGSRPPVPWRANCAGSQEDEHTPLEGVTNMLGKTTLRELFHFVRYARGVLCGVSLLMHVAAALEKPAVVIAGGREPVAWNAYPLQHYLHTVGMLPCHDSQGRAGGACWRYRTVPLGDGTILDANTCERPVGGTPECLTMIEPKAVADLILKYTH